MKNSRICYFFKKYWLFSIPDEFGVQVPKATIDKTWSDSSNSDKEKIIPRMEINSIDINSVNQEAAHPRIVTHSVKFDPRIQPSSYKQPSSHQQLHSLSSFQEHNSQQLDAFSFSCWSLQMWWQWSSNPFLRLINSLGTNQATFLTYLKPGRYFSSQLVSSNQVWSDT